MLGRREEGRLPGRVTAQGRRGPCVLPVRKGRARLWAREARVSARTWPRSVGRRVLGERVWPGWREVNRSHVRVSEVMRELGLSPECFEGWPRSSHERNRFPVLSGRIAGLQARKPGWFCIRADKIKML